MSCKIDFTKDWKLCYQGAESKLYKGQHSNVPCVIKHRFCKKFRHPVLDKKLTKERTKRERRMIERIKAKSEKLSAYMPSIIWTSDNVILMTEILNCKTLFDVIHDKTYGLEELALLLGECIAELHNIGLIHGDLTTSNLLLVPKTNSIGYLVVPIDFGLSTGSTHPEDRAVDLIVLERSLIATHFSDSKFFSQTLKSYISNIEPSNREKIIERMHEVRSRGRKFDNVESQDE